VSRSGGPAYFRRRGITSSPCRRFHRRGSCSNELSGPETLETTTLHRPAVCKRRVNSACPCRAPTAALILRMKPERAENGREKKRERERERERERHGGEKKRVSPKDVRPRMDVANHSRISRRICTLFARLGSYANLQRCACVKHARLCTRTRYIKTLSSFHVETELLTPTGGARWAGRGGGGRGGRARVTNSALNSVPRDRISPAKVPSLRLIQIARPLSASISHRDRDLEKREGPRSKEG